MREVRNNGNKLICCIDESNNFIEITVGGNTTRIYYDNNKIKIVQIN